jgi:hypothetical protein
MGDPGELEYGYRADALKESWKARVGTHMVHGVSPYTLAQSLNYRGTRVMRLAIRSLLADDYH